MAKVDLLQWQPYNKDYKSYVAVVSANVANDNVWQISTMGNSQWTGENIVPKKVLIDNLFNDGQIIISFGPFALRIPEFSRESYDLPPTINSLTVTGSVGIVNVIFSTEKLADDTLNNFGILNAKGQALLFPQQIVIGDTNMSLAMRGRGLIFAPGSPMQFNLLDIAANNIPNGWFCFIQNNTDQTVILKPSATGQEEINGVPYWYGVVGSIDLPFALGTRGDGGILICDGSNWVFLGRSSFLFALNYSFATATLNIVHSFWRPAMDSILSLLLQASTPGTADMGYQSDDILYYDWFNQNGINQVHLGQNLVTPTFAPDPIVPAEDLRLRIRHTNSAANPVGINKTSFAQVLMGAAFWQWQWRSYQYW